MYHVVHLLPGLVERRCEGFALIALALRQKFSEKTFFWARSFSQIFVSATLVSNPLSETTRWEKEEKFFPRFVFFLVTQ